MKSFEEICREYEKSPEQAEKNLYLLLQHPEIRITSEKVVDREYCASLKQFLIDEKYIAISQQIYRRTTKGEVAKIRGWVCIKEREYKILRIKQLLKDPLFYISVLASVIAAICSVIMLIRA